MIKTIVIIAVVLVAALFIYAATKPDTFRVQRARSIKAPPETIFPLINDFYSWGAWSPYEKLDPTMEGSVQWRSQRQGRRAVRLDFQRSGMAIRL